MISTGILQHGPIYQEISSGIWFVLSLAFVWVLVSYIIRELIHGYKGYDPVLMSAAALLLYFLGTAVRVGTTWGAGIAARTEHDVTFYINTVWYTVVLGFSIFGLVWMIWLFAHNSARVRTTAIAVVAASVIPVTIVLFS